MTPELLEAAQTACQQMRVIFSPPPADGKFHSLDIEGKPRGGGQGRIRVFPDMAGGQVWNHTESPEPVTFWAKSTQSLTPAELTERKRRAHAEREKADRELDEVRQKAARLAVTVLRKSKLPLSSDYLLRKQVLATDTIFEISHPVLVKTIGYHPKAKGQEFIGDKILVIPVRNEKGIITIEMIDQRGLKAGLANGQKKGGYWATHNKFPDGDGTGLTIGIGEGVATMLTYNMATGNIGIAALSCGNLMAVAKYFRQKYPAAKIVIVADRGNGEQHAVEAAHAVGGSLVLPELPQGSTGSDINDVHCEMGLDEARRQIEAASMVTTCTQAVTVTESVTNVTVTENRKVTRKAATSAGCNRVTNETTETADDTPTLETSPQSLESEVIDIDVELHRLASLSAMTYERIRTETAAQLGIRATVLDKCVADIRKNKNTAGIIFEEIEPYPETVDGAVLLDEIKATIKRFIVCHDETATVVTLWIAMTWFIDVVQIAPLAIITAPEKRCGKSQLLFLIGKLALRPLTASGISPAALFRSIEKWAPTLLIDEADAFMKDNEDIRLLLNSGHSRDAAYIIRTVGDNHEPTRFNTWGAKAVCGISAVKIAATLTDRAVVMELRRKLDSEQVDRLRYCEPGTFETLTAKLARFAADNRDAVRCTRPDLPPSLNDRAQDNWEPLLAIATVAGGHWLQKATHAALHVSGTDTPSQSTNTELLHDVKIMFERIAVDRISTVNLIKELCHDEEAPWATYNRGKAITPRQLSKRLNEFGILPKSIRTGVDVSKGYALDQFQDTFTRYLTLTPPPSVTRLQTNNDAALRVTECNHVTVTESPKVTREAATSKGCTLVTDRNPETAESMPNFDF